MDYFTLQDQLDFGKYRGRTILDVFAGRIALGEELEQEFLQACQQELYPEGRPRKKIVFSIPGTDWSKEAHVEGSFQGYLEVSVQHKASFFMNCNPGYIEWAIQKVNRFVIRPEELEKLADVQTHHIKTVTMSDVQLGDNPSADFNLEIDSRPYRISNFYIKENARKWEALVAR
tara:strand:- start:160 stop:681 length:522 start_codon:yes stop_codon:yes gene_type:complete